MRYLAIGLMMCFAAPAWGQPNGLSECLFTNGSKSAACTAQIIRFESQHAYVPHIAESLGIDPDLVFAVIAVESGYSTLKPTDRGGIGPMQVTAVAAQDMGVNDLTYLLADASNVQIGSQYLRKMMQRFGDWRLALAAYNAGPGAVQKFRGIPPYRETEAYVRQVLWWYLAFKNKNVLAYL